MARMCSLHPMDVRLLKLYVGTLQGDAAPDLRVEATRRRQRDILINWSRKIIQAAAVLEEQVDPEYWLLYTRFRPFFITAESPEQAAELAERLLTAQNLSQVLNYFLEELARIDPERADAIVASAQQDKRPGILASQPVDEIQNNLRAYLLYERRQLEELAEAAAAGTVTAERLTTAARWLSRRACVLLANLHPSWQCRGTSLTLLAERGDLGWKALVADPRGMFQQVAQRIPGLYDHIPFSLSGDEQTGLCLRPVSVPQALELMERWPRPLPPHPTLGTPSPGELLALREALVYAQRQKAGLWEAADLAQLDEGTFPIILADQGQREEHPERFAQPEAPAGPPAQIPFADGIPDDSPLAKQQEYLRRMEATNPVSEEELTEREQKTPWWKRLGKKQ